MSYRKILNVHRFYYGSLLFIMQEDNQSNYFNKSISFRIVQERHHQNGITCLMPYRVEALSYYCFRKKVKDYETGD